jgi:hypothetical protein
MYGSNGLVQETGPVMRKKRPLNKVCTGQLDSYSSSRTPVHLTCTSSSPPPLGGTTDSYRYTAKVPLPVQQQKYHWGDPAPAKGPVPDEGRGKTTGDKFGGVHTMPHLTEHQKQQAREMHSAGMSYRAIARQLRCPSDSTVRALFIPKKSKPIPTTPRKLPPPPKPPVTKSVLVHHVRTSSTSVPMRRRHDYPPLNHTPSRTELYAMLHQAVRNTRC